MDALIPYHDSYGELLHLQKSIRATLATRGFQRGKYSSNSKELLKKISNSDSSLLLTGEGSLNIFSRFVES